jgi:hypothetical protein
MITIKYMKNNKINFFKNKFFLNLFVLLAILKTVYIAIVSEYFNLISTSVSINFRLFIILLGIILLFYQKNKSFHKFLFYILFLFLLSIFVFFFQLKLDSSIDISEKKFYYLGIASSIIVFVVVMYACYKNLVNLDAYLFYFLIFFSIFVLLYGTVFQDRLQLRSLDPISTGYYAGILTLISFWRFLYCSHKKLISFIGVAIGSWLLFQANSKSPILGVLFGIFLLLPNMKSSKIICMFFIFFILCFILLLSNLDTSGYRIFNFQDKGSDERILIYQEYFKAILNNFIFPYIDPSMNLTSSHNIFLSIYSATGLLGLIIFIYLIYYTLIRSYRLVYYKTSYGWISLIFILTLTTSSVSGAILSENFWIFFVLINVYYLKYKKENM